LSFEKNHRPAELQSQQGSTILTGSRFSSYGVRFATDANNGEFLQAAFRSHDCRNAILSQQLRSGVEVVSLDKSLRSKGRLARTRSVLTRDERIKQMKSNDKWVEGQSPLGLPKTRIVRLVVGKKKKKKTAEEADKKADPKAAKKK